MQWVRDTFHALGAAQRRRLRQLRLRRVADEVAALYGDRLARLTALKDRWDPGNVFRHNANVVPSGTP